MVFKHKPVLFKTTKFSDDNLSFINFGYMIEDASIRLSYVSEFTRKSYKSKVYTERCIYSEATMHNIPDVCIPASVKADAEMFMHAVLIASVLHTEFKEI